MVRPGEERELRLTYRLPPALATSPYSLLVQKQPGTAPFPLRIHGGAGDDAIESRPNADQAFVASGGQLRASGLEKVVQQAAPGPACEVVTSPPQVLRSPSAIVIPRLGVQAEVVALGAMPAR